MDDMDTMDAMDAMDNIYDLLYGYESSFLLYSLFSNYLLSFALLLCFKKILCVLCGQCTAQTRKRLTSIASIALR